MSALLFFDANATTPCCDEAIAALLPYLKDHFGNVSSSHALSREPLAALASARASVAELVGARPSDVVFCSCATESINSIVFGLAELRPMGHIVAGATEHVAVLAALNRARSRGARVTLVDADPDGRVSPALVAAAIEKDTFLVSLMLANNETGAVNDVARAAALVRERASFLGMDSIPFLHSDCAQAAGKMPVDINALGVDAVTLAAHKLYGPKGIGATIFRVGAPRPPPLLIGGNQEGGARSGTENIPYAAAFGAAARVAIEHLASGSGDSTAKLRGRFAVALKRAADASGIAVTLNGPLHDAFAASDEAALSSNSPFTLPNTLSLAFAGSRASSIVATLASTLAISAGSACHAGVDHVSHVLKSMHVDLAEARGTVRISIARGTSDDDVDAAVRLLVRAAIEERRC